jgi:hypothetical protein
LFLKKNLGGFFVRFGGVWFGLAWFGLVWSGLAWLVWFGLVWSGLVWFFFRVPGDVSTTLVSDCLFGGDVRHSVLSRSI